jgi:protein gp37
MGQTKISYADYTHNGWWGCTHVEGSPACKGACYAEDVARHYHPKLKLWDGGILPQRDEYWGKPLGWNRKAEREDRRRRVFCMSMGDWAEGRPAQAPYLERLWTLIESTQMLDWLMLTKRPQLIGKLMPERIRRLARVWQGTTAENQRWLDRRCERLKLIEADVYWSCEPLVERIKLPADFLALGPRAWVVCGGMSGPHAKATPLNPDWARDLRDQCLAHCVRFHMKQMSGLHPHDCDIPEDLRIRQYPQGYPDTGFEKLPALRIVG